MPRSPTHRACSSTSPKSSTVYCDGSAGTCSSRSGSVQRETAPSPITRLPPSAVIFSQAPPTCYRPDVAAAPDPRDPLALDAETMRRLGYLTVDRMIERWTDRDAPPLRRATPDEMRARLAGPPPGEPAQMVAAR